METKKMLKNAKFYCSYCNFSCCKKSNYIIHTNTQKHLNGLSGNEMENAENAEIKKNAIHKCECGKNYVALSGLWKHKTKRCSVKNTNIVIEEIDPDVNNNITKNNNSVDTLIQTQTTLILELVKQNQEFKQLLLDQNKTMIEVAKNSQVNNTISNNNNNSNNKTFNLNFFLNETCKDAMNMKDFIQSLDMSFTELEKMGEIGFAEGMSRLFIDRLNKLDITKRPIHCSDVKREIIHIKDDNKWERDNANLDRLRKIIKQLTHKNILRVDDWKQANKGCTEYNSRKNEQYLKMNIQAIGPVDDDEVKREFGKIIRRVAESTAIDKKYLVV